MNNKRTIIALLFIFQLFTIVSYAQEKFDTTTFSSPKGWQKEAGQDGNAVRFTKEDAAKNSFCMITVFKAIPGGTDSKVNFDSAWEELAKKTLGATSPQMNPAKNNNGWEVQSGLAAFQKEGLSGIALLVTASAENRMINILMVTNTDTFQADVEKFFASVKLPPIVVSNVKTPISSPITSNTSTKTVGNCDVWYSYSFSGIKRQYSFKFLPICANGDALEYVPSEGMLGVGRATRPQYGWGKRKEVGNEVHIEYPDGTVRKMGKVSARKMSYPPGSESSYYVPLASVDGLRLDGEFSSDSPDWYRHGKPADIIFRSNGTFVNNGIQALIFDNPGNEIGRKNNGPGTYLIKDFTIVFTYSDGTVARAPFVLSISDPNKPAGNLIMMHDYPLYKKIN